MPICSRCTKEAHSPTISALIDCAAPARSVRPERDPLGRASRRLALLVLPPQIPGGSAPEISQVLRLFVELASDRRDRFGLLDGLPAEGLDDRAGLLERRLGRGLHRRAVLSKPRVRRRPLADLLRRQGPVELTRRQEITGWPRLRTPLWPVCLLPRRPALSLLCPLQGSVQRVGGLRQSRHEGENIRRRRSGGFGRQGLARVTARRRNGIVPAGSSCAAVRLPRDRPGGIGPVGEASLDRLGDANVQVIGRIKPPEGEVTAFDPCHHRPVFLRIVVDSS